MEYKWTMKGTAADTQTWETSGSVDLMPGNFDTISSLALRNTFMQLTSGKAVFGKPGVGCRGPYSIDYLLIERQP